MRERIEAYFAACSAGTAGDVASYFTSDAVVYDLNVQPVRGAAAIGTFWVRVREKWHGARWVVSSYLGDGDHAAIEWAMHGRVSAGGESFVVMGSEHYRFEGDRIAEIRQYWRFDPRAPDARLLGYDGPLAR